jgi:putative glutamine amidotransferase
MKSVVVSQRVDVWKDRDEHRDALDRRLMDWVLKAGFIPFPVPNSLSVNILNKWLKKLNPSAILLSGGNDIGDAVNRDNTETELLKYASRGVVPVLGICRGMQFMACRAGGTLEHLNGHVKSRHKITLTVDAEEFPEEVNSFHTLGIKTIPTDYEVLARATQDGSIEAIRHRILPWEGWMWHPERENPFCKNQLKRFRALVG